MKRKKDHGGPVRDFEQEMRDASYPFAMGSTSRGVWLEPAIRIMQEAVAAERERVTSAAFFALGKAGVYPETVDRFSRILREELSTQDSEGEG